MTAQLPIQKERLEGIARGEKCYTHDDVVQVVRALLAAHEQEPVMEVRSHFNGEYVCRKLTKGTLKPGVKLYRNPATVPEVPDECPKCNGTGMMDSGGVQPWGEPIQVVCDCRYEVPTTTPAVPDDYFASLVIAARIRAEKAMCKFPQPNYVLNKVAEESGEVIKAVIHYTEGREEWSNVEGEIIDNLAMLIRLVSEGDQVIGFTPPASCRAAMLNGEKS